MALSVLVTTSEELADAVEKELAERVAATKHSEWVAEALGGSTSGVILVSAGDDGFRAVDAYAEHLEIQTANAREDAARVRDAGAIFVGAYPVPLGRQLRGVERRAAHRLVRAACAVRCPRRRVRCRSPRPM